MAKRLFDLFFSILGLAILLPVFLIIALVIKLDSKGPVFFRQCRVGRDSKEFFILKFRTMVTNAEQLGKKITVGADRRITRSGKFLRASKMDELPQLINVLVGQMSFVGPRPEVPEYVRLYTPEQREVLRVRPGITDLASIRFRNESELLSGAEHPEELYIQKIMPYKLELNREYIQKISVWRDIIIIFRTFKAVLHDETQEQWEGREDA